MIISIDLPDGQIAFIEDLVERFGVKASSLMRYLSLGEVSALHQGIGN
ncbi:MAG TPA: hypothetical protein PLQ35_04415 [bacterium]|nr:hypothetical protein [bacterium]HQL61516.1 hypothetical protein [bacterium]